MSMSSEITRITSLRNRIRTKLVSLGVINDSSADLEDCADGVDSITGTYSERVFVSDSEATGGYFSLNGNQARGICFEIPSNITSLSSIKSLYLTSSLSNPNEGYIFAGWGTSSDWSYLTFWVKYSNAVGIYYLGADNCGIFESENKKFMYLIVPYLGLTEYYEVYYTYVL